VISGEADPLVRVAGGRDTARQIPGSTFVSYPGMGHNLPAELWPDIISRICTTRAIRPARKADRDVRG
jgi:pimeloyl-ACP methyl ester carboxylesterase